MLGRGRGRASTGLQAGAGQGEASGTLSLEQTLALTLILTRTLTLALTLALARPPVAGAKDTDSDDKVVPWRELHGQPPPPPPQRCRDPRPCRRRTATAPLARGDLLVQEGSKRREYEERTRRIRGGTAQPGWLEEERWRRVLGEMEERWRRDPAAAALCLDLWGLPSHPLTR